MRNLLLIVLISFFYVNDFYSQNFERTDSIVLTYPKSFRNPKELAKRISNDFNTELEKVRAVYTWIAENIMYDRKEYGIYNYTYTSEKDRELKRKTYYKKLSKRVISKGKAVCEGYSILFLKTCDFLNIKATFVNGLGKIRYLEIGNTFDTSRHSWNIVEIDNEKFLLDVTWAEGSLKLNKFRFEYNFLTPPDLFIKNHYPYDFQNSLLKNKFSKFYFINSPLFYMNENINKTKLVYPLTGTLKKAENKTQKFIFETSEVIYSIHYTLGYSGRAYEIKDFHQNGKQLEFQLDFNKMDKGKYTIIFNYKLVVTYNII
tara:strand:- start:1221 stop:2168 length:948 start_codon:yes stop_codon:yes gene_type:complete